MTGRALAQFIGGSIAAAGFGLVLIYAGWLPALGVFLAMWGNNLQQHAASLAEKKD